MSRGYQILGQKVIKCKNIFQATDCLAGVSLHSIECRPSSSSSTSAVQVFIITLCSLLSVQMSKNTKVPSCIQRLAIRPESQMRVSSRFHHSNHHVENRTEINFNFRTTRTILRHHALYGEKNSGLLIVQSVSVQIVLSAF